MKLGRRIVVAETNATIKTAGLMTQTRPFVEEPIHEETSQTQKITLMQKQTQQTKTSAIPHRDTAPGPWLMPTARGSKSNPLRVILDVNGSGISSCKSLDIQKRRTHNNCPVTGCLSFGTGEHTKAPNWARLNTHCLALHSDRWPHRSQLIKMKN